MELRMKRYVHILHFTEESLWGSFILDNIKLIWNNKINTQAYKSTGIVVKHKGIPSSCCWRVTDCPMSGGDLFARKTIHRKANSTCSSQRASYDSIILYSFNTAVLQEIWVDGPYCLSTQNSHRATVLQLIILEKC